MHTFESLIGVPYAYFYHGPNIRCAIALSWRLPEGWSLVTVSDHIKTDKNKAKAISAELFDLNLKILL